MAFGCGPSAEEKGLEAQQASFSQMLQTDYRTRFAQQNAALENLNSVLSPIVAAGPNQQGFSPEELAARNTEAINATAGNFRNAQQSVATTLAGRGGGGTSGITSGIDKQITGEIASNAAGQLSQEQNQIIQQNYATGRQNFWNAETGAQALAGQYNPLGFASPAITANNSAFQQADTIQQQTGQEWADIGGAILGGVTDLAGGLAGAGIGGKFMKGLSGALGNQG